MGLQNYCLLIVLSLQVCFAQRVLSAFPENGREFYQPYTPNPNDNRQNEPAFDDQPSKHSSRGRYLSAQEQQKSLESLLNFVEKERSSSQNVKYSYQPVQQNVPVLPLPPKPINNFEAPLRVQAIPISHGKLQEIGSSREYEKAPVNQFFANQGVAGSVRLSSTGAKTAPFQSREKTVEVNGIHVPIMSKMVKNTKLNFLETANALPVSEKFSSSNSVTHPQYNNVIDIDGVTVPSRSKMVKNAKINLLQSSVQFFGSKGQPAGSRQVAYPNRHRNMIDLDGIQVPHMSKMMKNTKLNILQQTSQFVENELYQDELNIRAYNQANVQHPTFKPNTVEEPVEPNVQGFRVRGDSSNRIIFLDIADLGFNVDSGSLKLGNSELIPVDGLSISTPNNAGAQPNVAVAGDVNNQHEHVIIHKDAVKKMVSTHIQHDPSIHESVDISQFEALPSMIKLRPQNTRYLQGPPSPPTFHPSTFDLSIRPVSKSTKSKPRPLQSKVFFKKVNLSQKSSKKESKNYSRPSRKPLGSKQYQSSSKTSFSSFPSRSKTPQSLPGRPDGPKQADNEQSFHRFSIKSSEPEPEASQTQYQQQTLYPQHQQQVEYQQPQQQSQYEQPQQQTYYEEPQQQSQYEQPQTYYEESQQQSQYEQPQQQTYYEEPQQQSQYEQPQTYYEESQQQSQYEQPQQQTYYEEPQQQSQYEQPQQQNYYEEPNQEPQQQSYYEEPQQNPIQTNYDAQKAVQDGVNEVLRQQAAVLELQKQHARITQEAQHQPNHFHQQLHQPQQSLLQHFQLPYQQPVVHGPQVPGLAEHSRYVVELQAAQQALGAIQG